MNIDYFHVDTFTGRLFSGNPAGVCLLPEDQPNEQLQRIAAEVNLPVTAFLTTVGSTFHIRWFTPDDELSLCGHGTLAAASVIFHQLNYSDHIVKIESPTAGLLAVKNKNDLIELNFPSKKITNISPQTILAEGLGTAIREAYLGADRVLVVVEDESIVQMLDPNFELLKQLGYRGIVVTGPSQTADFVSRTFYPGKTIKEDPVTGSSHCLLVPYWAKRLKKRNLYAKQLSKRGGELFCDFQEERTLISGEAKLFLKGRIAI